jgi:hypothetical protein
MDNKYKLKCVISEIYAMWVSEKGINIQFKVIHNNLNNWINHKDVIHDDDYETLRGVCAEINWIDNNRTKSKKIRKPLLKKLYDKFHYSKL